MGDGRRSTRFTLVSEGHLKPFATCGECGAVLTPGQGEVLMDVLELHAEWHAVMRATAEEIKAELRAEGFDV